MKLRSIAIYPQFEGDQALIALRQQYDHLANKVPYHITLVFPFSSAISSAEIEAHLRQNRPKPFFIELGRPVLDHGLVMIPITEGCEHISRWHDALYQGLLSPYLSTQYRYLPHITIGRSQNQDDLNTGLKEASKLPILSGWVTQFGCEIIAEDDSSNLELTIHLGQVD
jgi:2'-5' RNA ligase